MYFFIIVVPCLSRSGKPRNRHGAFMYKMAAMNPSARPVVLALSGHDPSGAAGAQADIETLAGAGCHCVSVITCLTAQNTARFQSLEAPSPARFRERLELLAEDIPINACKIGLLGSPDLVDVITDYLESVTLPVVLDPILRAGAGDSVARPGLRQALTGKLFPQAAIVTPNRAEALALTGLADADVAATLQALLDFGCEAALVTGADETGTEVVNAYRDRAGEVAEYRWEKLPGQFHGSGCTLSACIAGRLARGDSLKTAVETAQAYTWQTLKRAQRLGRAQSHPGRFFNGALPWQ